MKTKRNFSNPEKLNFKQIIIQKAVLAMENFAELE